MFSPVGSVGDRECVGINGVLEVVSRDGDWFLGMEKYRGTIGLGKLADVLVLNANPLEDIRNTADIRYVMKGGRLFDGFTLDEAWPAKKPFGEPYWTNPGAARMDDRPLRQQ